VNSGGSRRGGSSSPFLREASSIATSWTTGIGGWANLADPSGNGVDLIELVDGGYEEFVRHTG
jgi:hypothetical protein